MSIRRILAFTGIRSDYDLMSGLYRKIAAATGLQIGLIVSGAHLSPTYGYTAQNIISDGIPIVAQIETLLDADSNTVRLKSAAILLQDCLHTVQAYRPNLIIYAGDREEVIVGGLIGAYLKIPTVHFFGGDHATDGNVDNAVRHAASKLSSLHFVSHPLHKERLIKIGEESKRIFVIGSPALDKFIQTPSIDKALLLQQMGRGDWDKYAVVIFHPMLGQEQQAGIHFRQLLTALHLEGINAFVSYPNYDAGNKAIIKAIEDRSTDKRFCFYKNLGRETFINLLRHAAFIIGNSSVGLVEAPMIPLAAINVGTRQKGRLAAGNVFFAEQDINSIRSAILSVLAKGFQGALKDLKPLYGNGYSVDRALRLLQDLDYREYTCKIGDPLS